ncbi:MAG: 50S ribosomal protein L10 [bacterium]
MPTPEKVAIVEEVTEQLKQAKSVFLTEFSGLNVEEINNLRKSFRGASVQYRVVKNTLARLSAKAAGCDELLEYLEGPTALAFGMEDPTAPAKVITEFAKETEKLKIKACLFEGVFVGTDQISEIANLPSREELLARLMRSLNAPISNLVLSLNGILRNFVYALEAVKKQKEESDSK